MTKRKSIFCYGLWTLYMLVVLTGNVRSQDGGLGTAEIDTLAYSPDGSQIAVGGGPYGCLPPGTADLSPFAIRIIDSETGQQVKSLIYHLCTVNHVAWNSDGTKLVSSGDDGISAVWDIASGQVESVAEGIFGLEWRGAAWSPDDQFIADFGSRNSGVRIWDAMTGITVTNLRTSNDYDQATAMAWSPNGDYLAFSDRSGDLQIWDVTMLATTRNGQLLASYPYFAAASLAWQREGDLLALGALEIVIIDPFTGNEVGRLVGHTNGALSLSWSLDGDYLASASLDRTLRIWDIATETPIEIIQTPLSLRTVDWSPDGAIIAFGGNENTVQFLDAPQFTAIVPYSRYNRNMGGGDTAHHVPDESLIRYILPACGGR